MVLIEEPSGDEARGRFDILSNAVGPRDLRRAAEAQVAVAGKPLLILACIDAGVSERLLEFRFQRIESELSGEPPLVILEDYPYGRDQPGVAATELDDLSAMGKIHGCPPGCHP